MAKERDWSPQLNLDRVADPLEKYRRKWDPKRQKPQAKNPGGRPSYDDEKRLANMALMFATGEVTGRAVAEAARRAAEADPDPHASATAERLRKKYPAVRDELESMAAQRVTAIQIKREATTPEPQMAMPVEMLADQKRRDLADETVARIEVDPQFARHVKRTGVRPRFVALEVLQLLWRTYSPKRKLRR